MKYPVPMDKQITIANLLGRFLGEAIKAAKDLRYGDEVVRKIRKAKSSCEISRIMATARKASTV